MRDIGSRLELLVDDWLIADRQGVELKLHHPMPRETVLAFADAPWEGDVCFYVTVLKDGGTYRAYYRGKPTTTPDGTDDEVTCTAESQDGVQWTRPNVGRFEVMGTRANNVILDGSWIPATHNFCPFIDTRPGTPENERFKAVGGMFDTRNTANFRHGVGVFGFTSPDGQFWRLLSEKPFIPHEVYPFRTDVAQNSIFWVDAEQRYYCYIRTWQPDDRPIREGMSGNIRWIARITSPDLVHWTPYEMLDFGDAPLEHLYTNQIQPYVRAPHIYIGFPFRFLPDRKPVPEHPAMGVADGVFMTSRDGLHFHRWLEAFLRPGRDQNNWTDRNMHMALGVWQTAPDELSCYWVENYRHPTCRLRRGTLRLDGFVSAHASYAGGEFTTHPLVFTGKELVLNYATSAPGSVRVEIQDAEGHSLPGSTLADCPEMYGDQIEQAVAWGENTDVSGLAGQPVRLRFALKDADVYSLRFR
jgi:hypothetical protein